MTTTTKLDDFCARCGKPWFEHDVNNGTAFCYRVGQNESTWIPHKSNEQPVHEPSSIKGYGSAEDVGRGSTKDWAHVENYMDEARQFADQCWREMQRTEDPQLMNSVARVIATWMASFSTMSNNAEFYRDLLMQCAHNLGELREKAYIQDDGGIVDEPLALKIPGLVAELAAHFDND